jgi:hypothetical protein
MAAAKKPNPFAKKPAAGSAAVPAKKGAAPVFKKGVKPVFPPKKKGK